MRSIDPAGKSGSETLFSTGRKVLGEVDERRERYRLEQLYRTIKDRDGTVSVSSLYGIRRIRTEWAERKPEGKCSIYLESGRMSLLDGVDDPYTPAQLDFSSDLSIEYSFEAVGTMIGPLSFRVPVTPTVKVCGGLHRSVNHWGLFGAVVSPGESRVVTCPVCERAW